MTTSIATSPGDDSLAELCLALRRNSSCSSGTEGWPADSLRLCGDSGVYRWFLGANQGGVGWSDVDQIRGYLALAQADLATTFIITQLIGALRRIAGSDNVSIADRWLDRLVAGKAFATVGISHLTTSRRHLDQPSLLARSTPTGFTLHGEAPWVTGAAHADLYVIGATLEDGREILLAVESDRAGIAAGNGIDLVALSNSCTDRVRFEGTSVDDSAVLAGPAPEVMKSGVGNRTGGLQTSTLAIGLSRSAIGYLSEQAERREELRVASSELASDLDRLEARLLRAAAGDSSCDTADIRGAANRLVLRSTQAALTAAKGAGFVEGHPVGRWCREALFFLVWSCPQPIAQAYLCELAGIQSA